MGEKMKKTLMFLGLVALSTVVGAQTQVKPGFNLFSVQQDIEIGKQSAVEAERQLPLLNDRSVEDYVDDLVERLSAVAPGHKFPYQGKVVNATDINAFALPGGYLYFNRGLIEAARTEGELAGVIAHEISHIALRHGTHNASKAYATQAGIGVLGGILTRGKTRSTAQIINLIGGLGLNAVFLKYSRDAETQADIVGTQIMSRAGYDPMEMANFFEVLRKQHEKDPGRLQQFISSHPSPANRSARVQQEARLLGSPAASRSSGRFASVQTELRGMPAGRSMQQIASGQGTSRGGQRTPTRGQTAGRGAPARVQVAAPSSRFSSFRQRDDFFEVQHPDNWRAYEAENGFGVTIVPEGGVVETEDGQQSIVEGVIVNHYDPIEGRSGRTTLDSALQDLTAQIRQSNTHLRSTGSVRRETIDGQAARSLVLAGPSPVTGDEERVTVFARQMGDGHIIYALFIAPARDYPALSRTFTQMMNSMRVNDEAAHAVNQN
jgi:Zn-dependent protease with chaperone function